MKKYILALDQGTTSSRAVLFDRNGRIAASAQRELKQIFLNDGWVEHDPLEIFNSQYSVMSEAISQAGANQSEIAAIGIANQRETTILWDRFTGEPVYNAIVWQCRRTSGIVNELISRGLSDYIRSVTGLIPDAYFSATKIKWILDNVRGVRERAEAGDVLFGTVETWLIWKLTGGRVHCTDQTNASRTMLFNICKLDWDERLLKELDIPRSVLPEVRPSSGYFGLTQYTGEEIPITGAAGDQQAALFGHCCFSPGEAKNTYGTGCFTLMHTGFEPLISKNGLVTTLAAGVGDRAEYALEGSVFVGGAVIQWLRDEMRFFSDSRDAEYLAQKVPDTGGVCFVPAFTGIGAPHWDMYARGCIIGLTRATKREHIIRAAQESIAYQVSDLISAMEKDSGISLKELRVDGGASRDMFLMQFQSDILDKKLLRPHTVETTALGAAFLAGLAAGFWDSICDLKAIAGEADLFSPSMSEMSRREKLSSWHRAVERSRGWAKESSEL